MTNSVEQERSRCPEKPAGNSQRAIGKGFDAANAPFLFNPKGTADFDVCSLKLLVNSANYYQHSFHEHLFKIRRVQNCQN